VINAQMELLVEPCCDCGIIGKSGPNVITKRIAEEAQIKTTTWDGVCPDAGETLESGNTYIGISGITNRVELYARHQLCCCNSHLPS